MSPTPDSLESSPAWPRQREGPDSNRFLPMCGRSWAGVLTGVGTPAYKGAMPNTRPEAPMNQTTVTANDGTVMQLPPSSLLARYAVAMFGEGHAPLDDGSDDATDALVTIAGQWQLDVERDADPYNVRA